MPPKGQTAGGSKAKRAKTGQVALPNPTNANTLVFRKGCVQILQDSPAEDVKIRKSLPITLFIFLARPRFRSVSLSCCDVFPSPHQNDEPCARNKPLMMEYRVTHCSPQPEQI